MLHNCPGAQSHAAENVGSCSGGFHSAEGAQVKPKQGNFRWENHREELPHKSAAAHELAFVRIQLFEAAAER